jgi:hypothetical protein
MTCCELELLYRQAEPGRLLDGYAPGEAIYCEGTPLAGLRSRATRLLWRGKHIEGAGCMLVNQWCGFRAIRARIYCGTSWLDGNPALIMDYRGTSRVWADVRDEVREVAPGLFLGIMFREDAPQPKRKMFFVLQSSSCCE